VPDQPIEVVEVVFLVVIPRLEQGAQVGLGAGWADGRVADTIAGEEAGGTQREEPRLPAQRGQVGWPARGLRQPLGQGLGQAARGGAGELAAAGQRQQQAEFVHRVTTQHGVRRRLGSVRQRRQRRGGQHRAQTRAQGLGHAEVVGEAQHQRHRRMAGMGEVRPRTDPIAGRRASGDAPQWTAVRRSGEDQPAGLAGQFKHPRQPGASDLLGQPGGHRRLAPGHGLGGEQAQHAHQGVVRVQRVGDRKFVLQAGRRHGWA